MAQTSGEHAHERAAKKPIHEYHYLSTLLLAPQNRTTSKLVATALHCPSSCRAEQHFQPGSIFIGARRFEVLIAFDQAGFPAVPLLLFQLCWGFNSKYSMKYIKFYTVTDTFKAAVVRDMRLATPFLSVSQEVSEDIIKSLSSA